MNPRAICFGRKYLFLLYLIFSFLLFIYIVLEPNSIELPLAFLSVLVFSFPVGYVSLVPFRNSFEVKSSSLLSFYVGIGFILNYLWIMAISTITLQPLPLFSLSLVSMSVILYLKIKDQLSDKKDTQNIPIQNEADLVSTRSEKSHWKYLIIMFIIPGIFFLMFITYYQHPILHSDLAHYHTKLTESILTKGKLDPYWTDGGRIDYPVGWHATTAGFSTLFNLSSLQTAFILIGITAFLVYGALLTISYCLTRSIWLTAASAVSFFFVPTWHEYQVFLYGSFIAGLGPVLLSILCLLSLLCVLLLIGKKLNRSYIPILLLLFIGTGASHAPLAIYFLIWFTIYLVNARRENCNFKKIKLEKTFNIRSVSISHVILGALIIGSVIGNLHMIQYNIVNDGLNAQNKYLEVAKITFTTGFTYIFSDAPKYFMIAFVVISMINLFYFKKNMYFTLVVFSSIMVATFASNFGRLEGFFVPTRINQLLAPFTWILLGSTIKQVEDIFIPKLNIEYFKNGKTIILRNIPSLIRQYPFSLIFIVITIIIFVPYLMDVIDLESGKEEGGLYNEFTRPSSNKWYEYSNELLSFFRSIFR